LRQGRWLKLGRAPLHTSLLEPRVYVQWPIGTSEVTVWRINAVQGHLRSETRETTIDDPAVQELEVAASWHAMQHVPGRLKADYGQEAVEWHIGGPVWRERRNAVEIARRDPGEARSQDRARTALLSLDH